MKVSVRVERSEDREGVFEVHRQAFETSAEAKLVDALRSEVEPLISLVATTKEGVVGHVLFSPVTVGGGLDGGRAMGLGPVGVLPEHQNKGIGSRLVRAGLETCRNMGRDVVFVLGHASYYPRFGFRPAAEHGFLYQGAVPNHHFMVTGLRPKALKGLFGNVKYHPGFDRF